MRHRTRVWSRSPLYDCSIMFRTCDILPDERIRPEMKIRNCSKRNVLNIDLSRLSIMLKWQQYLNNRAWQDSLAPTFQYPAPCRSKRRRYQREKLSNNLCFDTWRTQTPNPAYRRQLRIKKKKNVIFINLNNKFAKVMWHVTVLTIQGTANRWSIGSTITTISWSSSTSV